MVIWFEHGIARLAAFGRLMRAGSKPERQRRLRGQYLPTARAALLLDVGIGEMQVILPPPAVIEDNAPENAECDQPGELRPFALRVGQHVLDKSGALASEFCA